MLSVVVYGRNDQHGYNLHRRAALSLNALAEILADGDEILFVDAGSPDSVATFPEAIDDVLTDKTRGLLRIVRVRQPDLQRFGAIGAHIPESLARNIGARRAAPTNAWFLFTNTDVLLVESERGQFHASIRALAPGLYHAPRSEIPTYLWEIFSRQTPALALSTLREHGRKLGLVQRVAAEDFAVFDNPGDFQLVSRSTFEAVAGFDESMRFPFHVDSNFAVRTQLNGGRTGVFDAVECFHCEHSRSITRMNNPNEASNDAEAYVKDVPHAVPRGQPERWGAADIVLEEITLRSPQTRLKSYLDRQTRDAEAVSTSRYRADAFNSLDYDPESVSHFVADRLSALPADASIGWFGADARLLSAVRMRLDGLGRRLRPLLGLPIADANWGETAAFERILAESAVLVFAFGGPGVSRFRDFDRPPTTRQPSSVELQQLDIAGALRAAAAYASPRPIIVVNAVNTEFERMTRQLVQGALAPFSTRLRDGWLRPTAQPFDLNLNDLTLAGGAERRDGRIFAPSSLRGEIASGGLFDLPAGAFRLTADVCIEGTFAHAALQRIRLDVMAHGDILAGASTLLLPNTPVAMTFDISPAFLAQRGVAPLEVRVSGNGRAALLIKAMRVLPVGTPTLSLVDLARAHRPR